MRWIILTVSLGLATPVAAEDDERGRDMMAEALGLFMQGFIAEMEPAIDGFQGFLQDFNAYHPPEVLPNGDIIIRRKSPVEIDDGGDIEL
ncbi:MAG: hypothetical protein AAF724_18945 [Pseudomonadota bacterium]